MSTVIFQQNWPLVVKKDNMIVELPYMGKEYSLSFDLLINKFGPYYQSIIHISLGEDIKNYGDRNPGVWTSPQKKLSIISSISGDPSHNGVPEGFEPEGGLTLGNWTNVDISQTLVDGKVQE